MIFSKTASFYPPPPFKLHGLGMTACEAGWGVGAMGAVMLQWCAQGQTVKPRNLLPPPQHTHTHTHTHTLTISSIATSSHTASSHKFPESTKKGHTRGMALDTRCTTRLL